MSAPANAESIDVRERILIEATRLFAHKGYGSTSTREVVEAAGVTKPTLYYWFKNKDQLYLECVNTQMSALTVLIEEAMSHPGSVHARLHHLVSQYMGNARENPDGVRLLMTVKMPGMGDGHVPEVDLMSVHLRTMARLGELIAEGMSNGELRPDLDPAAAVFALIGTCNLHVVSAFLGHPEPADADAILDLFLRGAAPQ